VADRTLTVKIIGDDKSLLNAFTRSSRASRQFGQSVERASRGAAVATVGFRGLGRSIAFASGAFLGGAGFVAGVRRALDAASDLEEQTNKTNVLFGQSAGTIRSWARTTANSIGISQSAALEAAGNFGAMFETIGVGDRVSAQMSQRLVQLAADLASFANQDPSDMLDRLRSGLAGEAEPLRRFGVLLSEARVKTEAYRSGIAEAGAELTEQQKVQARYILILRDSAAAQGDFARTSESVANQERINAALREQAAATIGRVLLPAYGEILQTLNRWLADEKNLQAAEEVTERLLANVAAAARTFADVIRLLVPILERTVSVLGGTERAVKLLIAAFVAAKVVAFTGALTGLSTQALIATGRVTALRAALLRLGAIGLITIAIEIILHREQIREKAAEINKTVADALGLDSQGFFELPVAPTVRNLPRLVALRKSLEDATGEAYLFRVRLDEVIERLIEINQRQIEAAAAGPRPLREDAGTRVVRDVAASRAARREQRQADQEAIRGGQAIIDRITRQATAQRSLNQQLADSVTRAKHLKELIREDPRNARLQQRYRAELEKQVGLRRDIRDEAQAAAEADKEATRAARERARELERQAREAALRRRQRRQFRELGLTAEGEQLVAGVRALRRRRETLAERIKGTVLDTEKTRAQLHRIARVLSGAFGKVGRDVRQAIVSMFDEWAAALNQGDQRTGPLTKAVGVNTRKLVEGLGLTPEQIRELRARASSFTTLPTAPMGRQAALGFGGGLGGALIVESHTTINLDGQQVANVVTRNQQRANRRNPRQKRGPNRK
jgi:hypothetical protein